MCCLSFARGTASPRSLTRPGYIESLSHQRVSLFCQSVCTVDKAQTGGAAGQLLPSALGTFRLVGGLAIDPEQLLMTTFSVTDLSVIFHLCPLLAATLIHLFQLGVSKRLLPSMAHLSLSPS